LIKLIFLAFLAAALSNCGAPNAALLTHPKRLYSFPMYISVPGSTENSGVIYRINDSNLDAKASVETVIENLNFPTSLSIETDGTILFVVKESTNTGRIMKLEAGSKTPTEVYANLTTPGGITVDSANRLYVTQTSTNSLSRVISSTKLELITDSLNQPTAITSDESDNLIVTESSLGRVSQVIADGTRKSILTDLENPRFAGPGLVGNTFVIENKQGLGDGSGLLIPDSGAPTEFLSNLINPKSFAWEDGTVLFIAEGSPVFRIIKYSTVSAIRTTLAEFNEEPHTITLTPLK